jgi:iron(III) transport system substrate-binding protein
MVATSRKAGKTDKSFAWRRGLRLSLLLLAIFASLGCTTREPNEVVIYCALDREFAEPVLTDYEKELGLQVLAKYDVESTKTVGLANAIIAERNRPRCDLFWNNEILHTLRLKQLGLLETFTVPTASQLPGDFRGPNQQWYGFAARARVLLVNTELVPEDERPDSVDDLVDPKWAGKVGIAKPLFGTTATHAAVLFASRGEDQAMEFFTAFKRNGKVLGGNKQVAQAVASGEIAFGLTDTDDAIIEVEAGRPVAIVFPDQGDSQPGTLLVPNTLCLIQGGPHQAAARRLAEKIVSRTTEEHLARAASAQIPLLGEKAARPRILPPQPLRWMKVDFQEAANQWERVNRRLAELFSQT